MVITLAKEHRKRAKQRLRDRPEKLAELKEILADFEQFCWRMLKIKTKDGRIMLLVLNDAQRKFVRSCFRNDREASVLLPVFVLFLTRERWLLQGSTAFLRQPLQAYR